MATRPRLSLSAPLFGAALLCALLVGCSERSADPTVQSGAPSIFAKVMPSGFLYLRLSQDSDGKTHKQRCMALVDSGAAKEWHADTDIARLSLTTNVGSREVTDAIELTAEFTNGRWVLSESNVDAEDLNAAEFESKLRECMGGFSQDYAVHYEGGVSRASIIEKNLQSWSAAIEAGKS